MEVPGHVLMHGQPTQPDGLVIMGNPRRANGSRRTALRRRVAAMGAPCWICGLPIDYSLPPGDPLSFEVDELVPVSKGGAPLDPSNVAAAHRCCNGWRGNRSVAEVVRIRAACSEVGAWQTPKAYISIARQAGRLAGRVAPPPRRSTDW